MAHSIELLLIHFHTTIGFSEHILSELNSKVKSLLEVGMHVEFDKVFFCVEYLDRVLVAEFRHQLSYNIKILLTLLVLLVFEANVGQSPQHQYIPHCALLSLTFHFFEPFLQNICSLFKFISHFKVKTFLVFVEASDLVHYLVNFSLRGLV
jgi:hypothetical protein